MVIKIKKSQQDWLADTAFQVRQNNESPVPASERVYPQHLIQTAIDLLRFSDVDWSQVKNVDDLSFELNTPPKFDKSAALARIESLESELRVLRSLLIGDDPDSLCHGLPAPTEDEMKRLFTLLAQ